MNKLPHNADAEQYLAAVALLEPEQALSACSPDDFHLDRFRWPMQAVATLSARGEPVDAITLSHELERTGHLKEIGGVAELARLGSLGVIPSYARHYGRLVRESAARRTLLLVGMKIGDLAANSDGKDGSAIWAEAKQMLDAATPATLDTRFAVQGYCAIWEPRPPAVYLTREIRLPGVYLFYGPPEQFKTWLALSLAVCVATGQLWVGRKTTQGPVLIVDEENGLQRLADRLKALLAGCEAGPETGTPVHFLSSAGVNLLDVADFAALSRILSETGAKLLTIDALIDVAGGADENSAPEMAALMLRLRQLSEQHGCSVIALHHTRKSQGFQSETRDLARGSSAIVAAVDGALHVTADVNAGRVTCRWGKHRDGAGPPFCADFNFVDGRAWLSDAGAPEADVRQTAAETFILSELSNGPQWKRDLEARAEAANVSKSGLQKALYGLARGEIVKRIDNGGTGQPAQYALAGVVPPVQNLCLCTT